MNLVLWAGFSVGVHVALWFAFVFKGSGPEWTLGVIAAFSAAVVSIALARTAKTHIAPTPRMIAEAWRIPWYLVCETWEVLVALFKQLFTRKGADSYLAAVPYEACGDNPTDAGERALEVTYSTCTPNFIALGVVREQGVLLFHQVNKGELVQMTKNLGARPLHTAGSSS